MVLFAAATVIFLFPLGFAVIGVIFFVAGSESMKWKVIAVALVAASLLMQFVPALQVHFLIPLFIQLIVCAWIGIWMKLER